MANASRTETFDAPIDKIFEVLTDYESYPDFMDGVSSVEVVSRDGNKVTVSYGINVIKTFDYTLTHIEEAPKKLSWSFDSGDLFSSNSGSWDLVDNGDGTTQVTYNVEIDFRIKVPGMITKKLVSGNLPAMMKSVAKRAQKR